MVMSLFKIEDAYNELQKGSLHRELQEIKRAAHEEDISDTAVKNQVDNQYWKSGVEIIKAGAGMFGLAGGFAEAAPEDTWVRTALQFLATNRESLFKVTDAGSSLVNGNIDGMMLRSRHEQEVATRKAQQHAQKNTRLSDELAQAREKTARLFSDMVSAVIQR